MICRLKELYDDMQDAIEKNNLELFGDHAVMYIKNDFCDKFLEIIKTQQAEHTETVCLFCVGTILHILHPLLPFVTEKLWKLFNFTGGISQRKYAPF